MSTALKTTTLRTTTLKKMPTTSRTTKLKSTIKKQRNQNLKSKVKVTQPIPLSCEAPTMEQSNQLILMLESVSKRLSAVSGFELALKSFEKIFAKSVDDGVRPSVIFKIIVRSENNRSNQMDSLKSFIWSVAENSNVIIVEMYIDKTQLQEKGFLNPCPLETIQQLFSEAPIFKQCIVSISGV